MPNIHCQPMFHTGRGYYSHTVNKTHCHKSHQNICNGKTVKGFVRFMSAIYLFKPLF